VEDRILDFRLSDFEREGLYLLFPDSTKLELTKENIEKVADRYWKDPGSGLHIAIQGKPRGH